MVRGVKRIPRLTSGIQKIPKLKDLHCKCEEFRMRKVRLVDRKRDEKVNALLILGPFVRLDLSCIN